MHRSGQDNMTRTGDKEQAGTPVCFCPPCKKKFKQRYGYRGTANRDNVRSQNEGVEMVVIPQEVFDKIEAGEDFELPLFPSDLEQAVTTSGVQSGERNEGPELNSDVEQFESELVKGNSIVLCTLIVRFIGLACMVYSRVRSHTN